MRIEQIKVAEKEGIPFEITTAAGDKFRVTAPGRIAYAPGAAIVVTDDGLAHVLPYLTMTSLSYLSADGQE